MCTPLSPSSTLFFSLHVAEASTFPADDCASVPSALLFLFALLCLFYTYPLPTLTNDSFVSQQFLWRLSCSAVFVFFFSLFLLPLLVAPSATPRLRLLFMYFCCSLPLAAQFLFLCCYFNTHVYKYTKAEPSQVKLRWAQQPHSGTNKCIIVSNLLSPKLIYIFVCICLSLYLHFYKYTCTSKPSK